MLQVGVICGFVLTHEFVAFDRATVAVALPVAVRATYELFVTSRRIPRELTASTRIDARWYIVGNVPAYLMATDTEQR